MNPRVILAALVAIVGTTLGFTVRPGANTAGTLQNTGDALSNALNSASPSSSSTPPDPTSVEFPTTSSTGVSTTSTSAAAVAGRSPTTAVSYPGFGTTTGPAPGTVIGTLPGLPPDVVGAPTFGGAVNPGGAVKGLHY